MKRVRRKEAKISLQPWCSISNTVPVSALVPKFAYVLLLHFVQHISNYRQLFRQRYSNWRYFKYKIMLTKKGFKSFLFFLVNFLYYNYLMKWICSILGLGWATHCVIWSMFGWGGRKSLEKLGLQISEFGDWGVSDRLPRSIGLIVILIPLQTLMLK